MLLLFFFGSGSTKHDPAMRSYKLPDAEKQNETKPLPTSPKKALIPPAFLHQTVTSQKVYPLKPEARDKTNPISMTSQYPSNQPLSPKKKALMPPGLRGELKLSTEQSGVQSGPIGQSKRLSSGESDKFASLSRRSYDIQPNAKPGSQPKHSEMVKARAEFTRLVLEQHEHVNEQNQTLKALDDELQNLEAQAQRKEKSDNMLKVSFWVAQTCFSLNTLELFGSGLLASALHILIALTCQITRDFFSDWHCGNQRQTKSLYKHAECHLKSTQKRLRRAKLQFLLTRLYVILSWHAITRTFLAFMINFRRKCSFLRYRTYNSSVGLSKVLFYDTLIRTNFDFILRSHFYFTEILSFDFMDGLFRNYT